MIYVIECVDEELENLATFFLTDLAQAIYLAHDIAYVQEAYEKANKPDMVIVNQIDDYNFCGTWIYADISGSDDDDNVTPLVYYSDVRKNIKFSHKSLFIHNNWDDED